MKRSRRMYRKPKKKNGVLILLVCLLAAALAVGAVLWGLSEHIDQPGSQGEVSSTTPTTTRRTLPKSFIDNNTFSPYVLLYDATQGQVLYEKQADAKCYPASLTKLVTALVAVENTPADTVFTVGDEVYMIDPASSRAYLTVGTRMTLEQLLQALLLPSGNDAAYVAAVQVGRIIANDADMDNKAAVSAFCKKMNEKATALGCTGTQFANPDGIHQENHYTTTRDMLKISLAVLQQPTIAEIVAQPQANTTLLSGQGVSWQNSNRLLHPEDAFTYEGATGLKTGSTDEAGYCLAASATRNGRSCVAIVMGAQTENGRWEDARGLLDISFQ